ncbi:MAG: SCO family protein [Candidatus Marisimplicoccus sp.]|jgi:protein SCO1/2|nr:SCO family protein [Flavobacteriaceae bacterium]RZP00418.1 MAG: SCO family protein [Flavobacteriales bacterium]|tara:strand:+ start:2023 stop:2721 length:699 start_codon:yes stop_codon:yes gene_type:complete
MNNNIKYIGLFIIIILFGVFSLPKIYERVVNSDITDSNRLNTNERLAYLTISDEKRKAPDFLLTNQDSILISNDDMIGKVYVLEFFFTRCPDICIEMNQNMKLLDEEFGDSNDFGIISITIDPNNDTPSILKKYSEALDVKSQNWHFLTGEKDYIYDLANIGFNIFANQNSNFIGGFEHQGYFALIDKDGYIRSRKDSFGNPIMYYLGINDINAIQQGIGMLNYDIKKLIDE